MKQQSLTHLHVHLVLYIHFSFYNQLMCLSHAFRGAFMVGHKVVGFTSTYAIRAYHHWCCEFESWPAWGVQTTKQINKLVHFIFMKKWNHPSEKQQLRIKNNVFHRQTYSTHHVINIKIKQNQHSVEGLLHSNIFALSQWLSLKWQQWK